ncbi:sensor histidine kinase [Magnetococcales bacterium HHB-1]
MIKQEIQNGIDAIWILNKSPDGVILVDHQGIVKLVNPAALELFNCQEEQILNAPFGFPVGKERSQEIRIIGHHGKLKFVELHSVELIWHSNRAHLVTLRDITQRKTLETELAHVNQELQDFVYIASHDLQEPLRSISTYVDFLMEDLKEDSMTDDVKEDLRFIMESTTRIRTMIQDLLTYSRSSRLSFKERSVNLNQCIATVSEDLKTLLDECGGIIKYRNLPTVCGEQSALTRVFQNLIENSLKFRRTEVPPEIHITAERIGENWQVQVTDNGIGINSKYYTRIFRPFQRLHGRSEYPGTGLGLSIVKKTVERHGGSIQVTSEVDVGSTFTITLPP